MEKFNEMINGEQLTFDAPYPGTAEGEDGR